MKDSHPELYKKITDPRAFIQDKWYKTPRSGHIRDFIFWYKAYSSGSVQMSEDLNYFRIISYPASEVLNAKGGFVKKEGSTSFYIYKKSEMRHNPKAIRDPKKTLPGVDLHLEDEDTIDGL